MPSRPFVHLILAALLALAAGQAAAQTKVPPIAWRERVLANGLHVYAVLDRGAPEVAVQMWYGVGAKNDPAGRSGFAHLFEHLMFKATRDMPAEYMDRLTEDVGGANDASTDNDYTDYYEVAPAGHLQRLLWAEAERLSSLVVDQANFDSERAVVEEEFRQRVLADPYGRLFELDVPEASFNVHPYHRPPIGALADLDAATLADVRAFHALYYRPDNASLIVVGDFDPAKLEAWVDRYFEAIPRPSWPIPKVTAVEPQRSAPRAIDAYGPDVPLPAIALSYPGPDAASPDAAALDVLDAVMTTGNSSRLYRALVYRQGVAQSVFSDADLRRQGGLIEVGAVLAAGDTPDQGLAALQTQLDRLRAAPISPTELTTAKNQLIAQLLRGRETIEGKAMAIGQAITVEGDAARSNTDVAALQAVTAADVLRVARAWLVDQRRVVICYRQGPEGQPDGLSQEPPAVAAASLVAPPGVPVAEAAPLDRRQAPPPPGPTPTAALPRPIERTLPNGLEVIVARTGALPIVSADLTVLSGSASDPPGLAGLTSITAGLMPEGTGRRSATEIAQAAELGGGALSAGADEDGADVALTGLSHALPQSLELLADVVRHPAFAQAELTRLRQQRLDALSVTLSQPSAVADLVAARAVFGAGPLGHPVDGDASSLARIDRAAVIAQHRRLWRPDNAVLVLTGDVEPEAAFAMVRQAFGGWPRPAGPPPAPPPPGAPAPPRVVVVDLPGAGQAAVVIASRSVARDDPDYYRAEVANAVLGGGYSARLNEAVRVKRGLSYGADSGLSAHRDVGAFIASAQTRNDAADQVAQLMIDEAKGLAAAPPAADELAARKSALTGDFGRKAETSAGLAADLSLAASLGVDPGEVDRFEADIDAVDAAGAERAAAKLVDPSALSVVVVGDAKQFLPALQRRFGKVEVIESSTLDLDRANLTSPVRP